MATPTILAKRRALAIRTMTQASEAIAAKVGVPAPVLPSRPRPDAEHAFTAALEGLAGFLAGVRAAVAPESLPPAEATRPQAKPRGKAKARPEAKPEAKPEPAAAAAE